MMDLDMSDLTLDFDPTEVEVSVSYEPLPEGKYAVRIAKVEMKPTKAGTGKRLLVSCTILDGQHRGRSVMTGLNVANPNPTAQEIGRKQLRQLLQAVGLDGVRDMSALIDRECVASVTYKEAQNGYPAGNDIKAFAPLGSVKAGGTPPAAASPAGGPKRPSFVG
jgi:hypothetical protein